MTKGSLPTDGGHLLLTPEERADLLRREPAAAKYVRRILGSAEYINNRERYCLWLKGISPAELRSMPAVMERVEKVRQFRLASPKAATRRDAATPWLFQEDRQPEQGEFIIVPEVSSGNRLYIPISFLKPDVVCTNKLQMIPDATLYHFGVLTSSVNMAWTRVICGRLKSDYDYSKNIVYNNFPWPEADEAQKAAIEKTAQGILDARARHPDPSLADLCDPLTMPQELLKAHHANDRAVMKAYGFAPGMDEPEIVAKLMAMHAALAGK